MAVVIKSQRALKLLEHLQFVKNELNPDMKRFPGEQAIWVKIDWEGDIVKNLSFSGDLKDYQKVLFESMATLMIGKPIIKLTSLVVRECEAFLRDRNSEPSLVGMTETEEKDLQKVFQWISAFSKNKAPKEYSFDSQKGPLRNLKLVDKIREIKAFLNSPEILTLYRGLPSPELVDVEDLTVFINAPYESERDKGLFEELHLLGVVAFQEENLNFIPDA